MLVSYEVVVDLVEGLGEAFEVYMRKQHIPEILATECFEGALFEKASATRYRTSYLGTQEGLDRYLSEHAAAFRADFLQHFPEGATPSRNVWSCVQAWPEEEDD
jgi:hypothetical protein